MSKRLGLFELLSFRQIYAVVNCHLVNKIGSALVVGVLAVASVAHSQPQCEYLFEEPFDQTTKTELMIIGQAMFQHVGNRDFEQEKVLRESIRAFIEIIDPLEMVILQSEHDALVKSSTEFLDKLEYEVFNTPKRTFFEGLRNKAQARYETLINKFFNEDGIRRKILDILKSGKTEESAKLDDKEGKQEKRPESESEIEDKFVSYIANYVLNVKRTLTEAGREITNAVALKYVLNSLIPTKDKIKESLDNRNLPAIIAKAFINGLDPHSDLLLGSDVSKRYGGLKSSFGGVGAVFTIDQNGLFIRNLIAGGPAVRAGLQEGDVVTHVSTAELRETLPKLVKRKKYWYSLSGADPQTIGDVFRGPIGTEVALKVLRKGEKFETNVKRDKIEAGTYNIDIKVVDSPKGKIAHVKFSSFFVDSENQLRQAILNLKKSTTLAGMIIDLRDNGGGSLNDAVGILGLFVKPGPGVSKITNREREDLNIPSGSQPVWDGPLVVLTDSYSASASELLSGSLQDYGRAIVVGDPQTYGKGSVQTQQALGPDVALVLTIALYFTPSGRSPQIDGVKADVVLESGNPPRFEKDYPHVLSAPTVPSSLPANFSLIPNKEKVIAELNRRSQARRVGQEKPTYDQNTAEAYKIIEDLIALVP